MKKKVLTISWILGLGLFVGLVLKIGPARIWDNLQRISPADLALLLLLRLLYWTVRTASWKIVFDGYGEKAGFGRLFFARLAGYALSYLTPSASIGGEPVRALMASDTNRKKALASVVVDKTIEIIVMVIFMGMGFWIGAVRLALPGNYKILFGLALCLPIAMAAVILVKQKNGLLTWTAGLLVKLRIRIPFLEKRREKIRETDRLISHFFRTRHRSFVTVFLFNCLLAAVWVLEIHMTLKAVGVSRPAPINSFLIVSLGCLAALLPAVPASIGTYEAVYVGIFFMVGYGADFAFSLTLTRRMLALLWVGIGIAAMAVRKRRLGPGAAGTLPQLDEVDNQAQVDEK
jgi:uncharacterized protein (TIRG00374 family)